MVPLFARVPCKLSMWESQVDKMGLLEEEIKECHWWTIDTGSCIGCICRNFTIRPNFEETSLLANSQGAECRGRVLPRNWTWRSKFPSCRSFGEAEFPLEAEVTPVVVSYNGALSPFPKLEMHQNKKRKRSVLILFGKSWGCERWKRGLLVAPKWILWTLEMSLYYEHSWWRFPWRISIGPKNSEVLVCLIPSTCIGMHSPASGAAVLLWGADMAVCQFSICQGLTQKYCLWYTSSIWPYAEHAKRTYVWYSWSGLFQPYPHQGRSRTTKAQCTDDVDATYYSTN